MTMTDTIADMLTRIRNANRAYKEKVDVPYSKIKLEIARILSEEGFIKNYKTVEEKKKSPVIRISLKYGDKRQRVIERLERSSTPGRRHYRGKSEIPKVLGGLGVAILSTSKGVLTDKQARRQGVGGEVLCTVY